MGQGWTSITNYGAEDEQRKTEKPALDPTQEVTELSMRQTIHVKDWGNVRDLDLVWNTANENMEDLQDVCFIPENRVAVSDRTKNCVQLLSQEDGEVIHVYRGTIFRPLVATGLTCSQDGNLVVCSSGEMTKGLRIFKMKKLCQTLSEWRNLFEEPRGVAITPTNEWIVLEGADQNCVNVMRENGTRIRHFGSQHLHSPAFVAVDVMGRIFVTDSLKDCVFVFDIMGQLLYKFGSRGCADNQLNNPQGICIDRKNNVYIADQFNDRISVFSSDGQFKFHLRTSRPLHQPRGLALNVNTGHLLVTFQYLHWRSLQLYVLREPNSKLPPKSDQTFQ